MSFLFHHPALAFVAWTLLSVAFGLGLGAVIRHADAAEQPAPEPLGTDTVVIDWNDAPKSWLA